MDPYMGPHMVTYVEQFMVPYMIGGGGARPPPFSLLGIKLRNLRAQDRTTYQCGVSIGHARFFLFLGVIFVFDLGVISFAISALAPFKTKQCILSHASFWIPLVLVLLLLLLWWPSHIYTHT